jgi:TolB protein
MQPPSLIFKLTLLLIAILLTLSVVSSGFAAGPTGASPLDPLMVPTSEQTIAPNTTLWFYFDYVTERIFAGRYFTRAPAQVAVDTNGIDGLQLSIYTPTQAKDWLNDPSIEPVGTGTPFIDKTYNIVAHDLYWAGGFNTSGRYLIAITNTKAVPVIYRLTVTGDTVTLYPAPTATPSPTLPVPITVTPVPTTTIQGKILFQTSLGGDIYTVNGDGSNLTRVSYGIDPAWSPDGKQITFARWDNTAPGVYIANADGSNAQLIYTTPRVRSPRWSPDGKYIAFTQEKTKVENTPIWKLGVVEVATGKLLEPQCSRLCYTPSWNSDSTTLEFNEPGIGIWTTNIFSEPATRVLKSTELYWDTSKNAAMTVPYLTPIQNVEWSPDGRRFVYSQQAHDRWELNTAYADGSFPVGITHYDPITYILLGKVVHNVAPTWSPDSQQILFLSNRNGKWEFFVVDQFGGNLRQVLKNVTDQLTITFSYENDRVVDWTK